MGRPLWSSVILYIQPLGTNARRPRRTWVKKNNVWHDVGHSLCRCVWVPVRGFLGLFWRETHTKGLRVRSPTRPGEDEGKRVPEKQSVREGQLREVGRTEHSREKKQSTEVGGSWRSRKTFEDSGLTNTRKWVGIPSGFVGVSLEYTLVLVQRMHKSVTYFSPIGLGANPSPWFLFFFFFHPLGCVFCVLIKECEIPLARDEKNH